MKTLTIGIMSREMYQKRLLDIAAGRIKPKPGDPKIWFSSIKSLSEVLSERNLELLKIMEEQHPATMTDLARLSGRALPNLSRTLKTLAEHGIVAFEKEGGTTRPVAKATQFRINYGIHAA